MAAIPEEDAKQIIEFYTVKKKSISAIAMGWHVSPSTVRDFLRKHGVELIDKKNIATTKDKLFKEFDAGKGLSDCGELSEKYNCSKSYAQTVFKEWREKHGYFDSYPKQDPAPIPESFGNKYLTVNALREFAKKVKIGDTFIIPDSSYGISTYDFTVPKVHKTVVTILEKYPNFAVTDQGCRLWVDLWDAERRYGLRGKSHGNERR